MTEFQSLLEDLIDDEDRDFSFILGDKSYKPINKSKLYISYSHLLNDESEYSFNNSEFLVQGSEQIKNKTDSQIYFEKVNKICKTDYLTSIDDTKNFILINSPNKTLKSMLGKVFNDANIREDNIPPFFEIRLYTNTNNNRAPRVFGFLGPMNILYVLFYDPFHKIYSKTKL